MPESVSEQLRSQVPDIMKRWEDRVRAEVPASADQAQIILRNSIPDMLEVLCKVLSAETDPRTAARDLSYITVHGAERADVLVYTLEEMILECQILQEVVLEALEPHRALVFRDRTIVLRYFGEVIRFASGEYARFQAAKLAKLDRAKDEFLAMLGHELRNPLGAIYNSLAVLRAAAGEQTLPAHALEIAERQVLHMKQMVEDLLDISRITQGKIVLHTQLLDLGSIVRQTVDANIERFRNRRHDLEISEGQEPINVEVDPVRLAQCLSNLLTNAAKYTHTGGRIEVTIAREDKEAVVRVRDNGIGISPHLLPHVFDLFHQAQRSLDRAEGGLGIGLTVVQRLIEMHGGRVVAESEGLGKGSEFEIRLPVAEAAPVRSASKSREKTPPGVRVLVVEDNEDAAVMMGHLLQMLGHDAAVANDGPGALAAVTRHRPDIAFVDIGLPGMNGYQLATKLRASESCPPTMKLVALTGYAADHEALTAAGFDHHAAKPLDAPALDKLLAGVVRTP